MARPPSSQPTEGELEILKVLWQTGPAELGAVRAGLLATRPVAATTVATMLKIMRDKGLVERRDGPRGYLWEAVVSQQDARSGLIGKLVDAAFDGSARRLVTHLLEANQLSDADREAIRRLLDAKRQQKPSS